jgi:hypothetical protein
MNVAVRRVGSVVLLVQNENAPTDQEWDEFLQILTAGPGDAAKKMKILVQTPGGSPTPAQRKRLAAAFGGESPFKVAVISDSTKVRFVHVTITLFYDYLALFSTKEIEKAFDHLQLTGAERSAASVALGELQGQLTKKSAR